MINGVGKLKGYGFIEVNGKRYEFTNAVSSVFDISINHYLSRVGLTEEDSISPSSLQAQAVNGFSLVAETPEFNTRKIYTELGFLPMNAFEVQGVDFKTTRLRGAAIASANGTVRGGGFNVVTTAAKSPMTKIPILRRKINIPVTTFYSLPSNENWIYHFGNKAFYHFETNGKVNKVEWDYESGLWGTHTVVDNNFIYDNQENKFTDGSNRMFAFSNTSTMVVFDFSTDTTNSVPLEYTITSTYSRYLSWDVEYGGLRNIQSSFSTPSDEGFVIYPDGTFQLETGIYDLAGYQWNPYFMDTEIFWAKNALSGTSARGIIVRRDDSNFNAIAQIEDIYDVSSSIQHNNFIRHCPRNTNNEFMYAYFNTTTPTSIELNFSIMPETYTTLLGVTPIPVELGDSLVIEYTFKSGN